MSQLRVEFSGYGHYGVCTIIDQDLLQAIGQKIIDLGRPANWASGDQSIGFDHALCLIKEYNEEESAEIKLVWCPRQPESALESHGLLERFARHLGLEVPPVGERDLAIDCGESSNSWFVRASLGARIWDVIESQRFAEEILPQINVDIRNWWEDQSGWPRPSPYGTVFTGDRGLCLQVSQPAGNGLWIAGCRERGSSDWQFTDHNTDTAWLAMGHVISLCTILKHCRASLLAFAGSGPVEPQDNPESVPDWVQHP